jgi:hypothetical protein
MLNWQSYKNEWQIWWGAAPHARQDTCCWLPTVVPCRERPPTLDQLPVRYTSTNEWLISQGAAPHASLDIRCWFLDHFQMRYINSNKIEIYIH